MDSNLKQHLASVKPLINFLNVSFERPNDSDFSETVKLFPFKINSDPYCLIYEFESFVAYLLSKEPNILSTGKAATVAHHRLEPFL